MLYGAGSLGRAVLRQLRDHQSPVDLVAVMTAHHGRRMNPDGLDPSLAVNLVESEGLGEEAPKELPELIEAVRPDVLIECIPQNIRSGEPSLGLMRTALDAGVNVVTANKAAVVLGYRDLLHRGARAGARFRFEATLLDGLPLFSTVQHLSGAEISHVRGVVNGTSSLVLESVQHGSTRNRGLARAQAQGIAEGDSVLDLDGWDAAAKAALIANVWMGGALRVFDVTRAGCETLKDDQLRDVPEEGKYRLVVEVNRSDEGVVRASVSPVIIEQGDPLHALKGAAGGITVRTRDGHGFTMLQDNPGLQSAAFAMIQDCHALADGAPQI